MDKANSIEDFYQEMKSILQTNNFHVSDYKTISYGLQFTVSALNWSGIIRIYQNKKGAVKIDCSQLKGGEIALKIQGLIEGKRTLLNSKKLINKDFEFGFPIIGTDESGKGDYFGPLVSAGVYIDKQSAKKMLQYGIRDSKELRDSNILKISRKIINVCRGRFAVIEISPKKYNNLYEQFKKEKKNLNTLLAWGHAKAIEEILGKVECKIAIADQFADERFILNKLQEKGKGIKLIQRHKAEQNVAVAAASILARERFLNKLSGLSKEYEIYLPKGASQKVVDCGKKIVSIHGEEALRNVAKLHFKTTNEVLGK